MAGGFKTLDDMAVAGKRVLVRVDFNLPMKDGKVTDATRIDRALPTINTLSERVAKVDLLSHFGRPKGQRNPKMSLAPVAAAVADHLGRPVAFAEDCIGEAAEGVIAAMAPGEIALLENLRFHAEEEANDPDFAAELAKLGEIFVADAFSVAHRAHASTDGLARALPAAAGRQMQAELEHLEAALESPERPLIAVVGGAKVSSKLDLLGNLVSKVDALVIGGGMANTFLYAEGKAVGRSLNEPDLAETAREILAKAEAAGCRILLPIDAVVAGALESGVATETVEVDAVPEDKMILDLGPESLADVLRALEGAKTVVWNGPLGAFETQPFDAATVAAARKAAELTKDGRMKSIAGGGDTVAALAHAEALGDFTYVSAAGGAFLEWLEGKSLPGVAVLQS